MIPSFRDIGAKDNKFLIDQSITVYKNGENPEIENPNKDKPFQEIPLEILSKP